MTKTTPAIRVFAPEQWGEVDLFNALWPTTYKFKPFEKRELAGVGNHLRKAQTYFRLAETLIPALEIDEKELQEQGGTSAQNAKNLAAVLEGAITEIYSAVDCTAKILHRVYGPTSRNFKDSTRRLFSEVEKIEGSFPDRLKQVISSATWYEDLRHIRDELTHRDTGFCSKDRETGTIMYFHTSFSDEERLKPIDDIVGWIKRHFNMVNNFVGLVFKELNGSIEAGTQVQVCGVVNGRVLMRELDAAQPIDFNNGTCLSSNWFDQPENPSCPFRKECGAYQRPASPDQLPKYFGSA